MNFDDVMRLANEGKKAEADILMKKLMDDAKYAPTELIATKGKPPIFKCRGKFVIQDENDKWVLKNTPKRKV